MGNIMGLYWVGTSGSYDDEGNRPPCFEVAPGLYQSVKVYAAFNLAFTVFMYVYMIGVAQLLRVAMRRGLLYSSNAAPEGSLERNTEAVNSDDQLLADQPMCSICFEDFFSNGSIGTNVAKTKK